MTVIKRIFGVFLIITALVILAHTLYGSVFYAAGGEDNGPSLAPIAEAVTSTTEGVISISTDTATTTSSTTPLKTAPLKAGPVATKPKETTTAETLYPTNLLIPSLNINANVQYVGINAKGNMGTPNNFTDVSWYKPGTVPGEIGSAVMAGHVDNGLALSGVFKHLSDIKPGDEVFVVRKDGSRIRFKVDRVVAYNYKDVPTASIFGAADEAHLNLVTCSGDWLGDQKTYEQRLVVYTTLVR